MQIPSKLIHTPRIESTMIGLHNKAEALTKKRYSVSFVSQEPYSPRLIISKMQNHTLFPSNANIGILIEKHGISLYNISRENKWQKADLNLSNYQNVYQTFLGIIDRCSYNNDDNISLLEACKLDKLDICPPISKQLFNSSVIIPISFDVRTFEPMRKHNGEMLNATMELVRKSLDKGKATIILDDTLQRWNIGSLNVSQISDYLSYTDIRHSRRKQLIIDEFLDWQNEVLSIDHKGKIKESMKCIEEYSLLHEISKIPSKKWKHDNKDILKQYIDDTQFNIVSWDDLKDGNKYIKYLDHVMTEYDDNQFYRSAIDSTIREYLDRHRISLDNKKYKLYMLCALKYIFEECAVFAQLIVDGLNNSKFDFHVYPSGETPAIKATRKLSYESFNATGFYPIKLNFKAKE